MSDVRFSLRHTLSICLALVLLAAATVPVAAQGIPNSIKLLYFAKKNFKAGDWVLYKIDQEDYDGRTAVDYQRVQIGSEIVFRGENCFWLETGWGNTPERLAWTTVLMSEEVFKDTLAEARADVHMRRMHISDAPDGTPLVGDARLANSFRPMSEMADLIPDRTLVGTDTLVVKGRAFVCQIWEEVNEYGQIDEQPDSSIRYLTRTTRRRWVDPTLPITGLIREKERKERFRHAWPLGKVSSDFPRQVVEFFDYDVQLVDFGTGAKPAVSDRVKHISDPTVQRQGATP